jgi:hypothetical protein
MARPKLVALVPVTVELVKKQVQSVTAPHTEDAQAALERFQHFKDELDLQLTSIHQSAGVLKSDEVVDDGACDAIVTCLQKIATAWNDYITASGMSGFDKLEPVADLEPSPYQED